ncbi:hypothetical protein [Candidatus Nitrosocosmicus sp. T]
MRNKLNSLAILIRGSKPLVKNYFNTSIIKKVFEKVDVEFRGLDVSYLPRLVKGHHIAFSIIEYADQHDVKVMIIGSREH